MTGQSAPSAYTVIEAAEAAGQHRVIIRRAAPGARPHSIVPLVAKKLDGGVLIEVEELRCWVEALPEVSNGR